MGKQIGRPFRVLSFDGGSSPAQNLRMLKYVAESLESAGQPGLLANTDLFVGNSAGAIAACYLSHQLALSPGTSEVDILSDAIDFFDQVIMTANGSLGAIAELILGKQAAIGTAALMSLLQDTFGDAAFNTLETPVCTTSFEMRAPAHPQLRCSAALNAADNQMTIIDACMQTSAFPLLYPLYKSHIDGAFVSNNPSMLALAQIVDWAREGTNPYFQDVTLDSILLFSLGSDAPDFTTGTFPTESESWGWQKWLGPHIQGWTDKTPEQIQDGVRESMETDLFNFEVMMVASALLYGNSQGVRRQCRQLCAPDHFFRLALPGRKSIGELMLVIIVGLAGLIAPMAHRYAREWKQGKLPTDPYNPSLDDTVNWLQSGWLLTL